MTNPAAFSFQTPENHDWALWDSPQKAPKPEVWHSEPGWRCPKLKAEAAAGVLVPQDPAAEEGKQCPDVLSK